jgi:hypothetical protein
MNFCSSGSGSNFGKDLVPVPARIPDTDLFSTVFQQQKMFTKSCLFSARSSIVSQKDGH